MTVKTSWRRAAAAAALALAAATSAHAQLMSYATNAVNWTHPVGTFLVPGMISAPFANAANQPFVVTFSSECSVDAAAGNTVAYTDLDLQVINAATGALVATIAPTIGNQDAFCSANGTLGFDGFSTHSITAVGGAGLPGGVYRVQVISRTNAGATGGWYGERTLVISR